VTDLKQRGLLDDTLVIWGGEFGRTPMGENRTSTGRNHHIECGTMWFAGGGTQPGIVLGETDELGFAPSKTAATSTTSTPPSSTCSAWSTPSSLTASRVVTSVSRRARKTDFQAARLIALK
jgi:hypothetical protein